MQTIKSYTEIDFLRLYASIEKITDEELDWKHYDESNTIWWLLTHHSANLNFWMPKLLKGDMAHRPDDWPADYEDEPSHSLEKILDDLDRGTEQLWEHLEGMSDPTLYVAVEWGFGSKTRAFYLMFLLSAIFQHGG